MNFIHLGESGVSLPYPVTDFSITSTLSNNNDGDLVISLCLFGGCLVPYDSEFTYFDDSDAEAQYHCPDISNANLVLASGTENNGLVVEQRRPMPRPRHHHTSNDVNGKIWIVGGRDSNNNIINEIDVYDEIHDTWTTFSPGLDHINLPSGQVYGVSDHCAFARGSYLFLVGGFDHDFKAIPHTIMIDVDQSIIEGDLKYSVRAPLNIARGACGITVTGAETAVIAGGFTHEDGYCEALRSAEYFHEEDNAWEILESPMKYGRARPNLVHVDHQIYAIGGERRGIFDAVNGQCDGDRHSLDLKSNVMLPNRVSYPVDNVETFSLGDAHEEKWHLFNSKWVVVQDKVRKVNGSYRYRAAPIYSSIYFIGGIRNHMAKIDNQDNTPTCENCFEQSSHIYIYDPDEKDVYSFMDKFFVQFVGIVGVVVGGLVIFAKRRRAAARREEEEVKERGILMLSDLDWGETEEELL